MIIKERGRYRSVADNKELNIAEILNPEEQELLKRIVAGDEKLIKEIYDDYREEVVPPEEFFKSEYYIGVSARTLRPKLYQDLVEIFNGNYNEIILGGAIRWGKTFAATLIMMRVLYELLCLKDPYSYFGIDPSHGLYFVNISVTEELALDTLFEALSGKLESSKFFSKFKFKKRMKEIEFPGNIHIMGGESSDTGLLGKNIVCAIMDEANFYTKSDRSKYTMMYRDKAEAIYRSLVRRISSMFNAGIVQFGKIVLLSSKRDPSDFVERRIKEVGNNPNVFVREYALYDVVNYEGGKFSVFIGDESRGPKILFKDEIKDYPSDLIEQVPDVFRASYETDLLGSLRDISGISASVERTFISRVDKLNKCFLRERERPFDGVFEVGKSYLDFNKLTQTVRKLDMNVIMPKYYPDHVRYIGIDFGIKKDRCGFVMGCISEYQQVKCVLPDGSTYNARLPVIYIDLMLGITSLSGELEFAWVRDLIYKLMSFGFKIRFVGSDSYQSFDTLQILKKHGINTDVISVDRSTMPYEVLKNCIYDERLVGYEYPLVIEELKYLQVSTKNKVDHLPGRSKDVADALAICVYALTDEEYAPQDIAEGMIVSSYEAPKPENVAKPPYMFEGEEEEVKFEKGFGDIPIIRT
jgi:hypothetical protein